MVKSPTSCSCKPLCVSWRVARTSPFKITSANNFILQFLITTSTQQALIFRCWLFSVRQILDRAYPKYQVSVHTFGSKAGTRPPHPVPMNMCFMFLIILRNINWWSHCDEKKGEFIDYFSKLNLRDTKDIFVFWSMVNKVLKVPNKNRHFLYFQTNATNLSTADNVN